MDVPRMHNGPHLASLVHGYVRGGTIVHALKQLCVPMLLQSFRLLCGFDVAAMRDLDINVWHRIGTAAGGSCPASEHAHTHTPTHALTHAHTHTHTHTHTPTQTHIVRASSTATGPDLQRGRFMQATRCNVVASCQPVYAWLHGLLQARVAGRELHWRRHGVLQSRRMADT